MKCESMLILESNLSKVWYFTFLLQIILNIINKSNVCKLHFFLEHAKSYEQIIENTKLI